MLLPSQNAYKNAYKQTNIAYHNPFVFSTKKVLFHKLRRLEPSKKPILLLWQARPLSFHSRRRLVGILPNPSRNFASGEIYALILSAFIRTFSVKTKKTACRRQNNLTVTGDSSMLFFFPLVSLRLFGNRTVK